MAVCANVTQPTITLGLPSSFFRPPPPFTLVPDSSPGEGPLDSVAIANYCSLRNHLRSTASPDTNARKRYVCGEGEVDKEGQPRAPFLPAPAPSTLHRSHKTTAHPVQTNKPTSTTRTVVVCSRFDQWSRREPCPADDRGRLGSLEEHRHWAKRPGCLSCSYRREGFRYQQPISETSGWNYSCRCTWI